MLSSNALLWTEIAAAICTLIAVGQVHALWKMMRDPSSNRVWSVAQGRITVSQAGNAALDASHAGAVIRYHYSVGGRDYEGDGTKVGGKARRKGLLAKALLKSFPEGTSVDVYYDPAEPSYSALEEQASKSVVPSLVFLVVFGFIGAILVAHAIAGKMIMMENGLPLFTLGLPLAALLVGLGSFVGYVAGRRQSKAAAAWPSTQGEIVASSVIRDVSTDRDDDGDERESITYRADVRFTYRVDSRDYSSGRWKLGLNVSTGSPKHAEAVVSRYPVGQRVAVYYDPNRPDNAALETANTEGGAMLLIFGTMFGLAGLLFMWVMTHGHWVNAATGM